MKQIHTKAKKANRISGYRKSGDHKGQSANREAQRIDRQPKMLRTFGQMIHHVQHIQVERFVGLRRVVVTKNILHAVES